MCYRSCCYCWCCALVICIMGGGCSEAVPPASLVIKDDNIREVACGDKSNVAYIATINRFYSSGEGDTSRVLRLVRGGAKEEISVLLSSKKKETVYLLPSSRIIDSIVVIKEDAQGETLCLNTVDGVQKWLHPRFSYWVYAGRDQKLIWRIIPAPPPNEFDFEMRLAVNDGETGEMLYDHPLDEHHIPSGFDVNEERSLVAITYGRINMRKCEVRRLPSCEVLTLVSTRESEYRSVKFEKGVFSSRGDLICLSGKGGWLIVKVDDGSVLHWYADKDPAPTHDVRFVEGDDGMLLGSRILDLSPFGNKHDVRSSELYFHDLNTERTTSISVDHPFELVDWSPDGRTFVLTRKKVVMFRNYELGESSLTIPK